MTEIHLALKIVIPIVALILIVALLYVFVKLFLKLKYARKVQSYSPNTVILHQFPRGYKAPSQSQFVLKLETWLRMAQIKYQNEHSYSVGPKGRTPWITYNGIEVADSEFCIEYLSNILDKDLTAKFGPVEQGMARAFLKMIEESTMWPSVLQRFVYGRDPKQTGYPMMFLYVQGYRIKKRAMAQGYARHTKEEVYSIGRKDLKSLNNFLTGKKYLLSNECCNEDASIFGIVSQYIFHENGPLHQYIMNECPNIVAYIENIKNTFWPDWDDCCTFKKSLDA